MYKKCAFEENITTQLTKQIPIHSFTIIGAVLVLEAGLRIRFFMKVGYGSGSTQPDPDPCLVYPDIMLIILTFISKENIEDEFY